jgi:S-DNA-T family DNA segregation ATPase FtsK/SpoIIIE
LKNILFAKKIIVVSDGEAGSCEGRALQHENTITHHSNSAFEEQQGLSQLSLGSVQYTTDFTGPDIMPVQAPANVVSVSRIYEDQVEVSWDRVERAFGEFGVSGFTCHDKGHRGAITVYDVELPVGMRVAQVVKETEDVAATLGVRSVRVVRGDGERRVRIEVQSGAARHESVWDGLAEVGDEADQYELPVLVGRDTLGKPLIIDLSRAPHILMAGATNSGKSVALHALIISLIARYGQKEVRLMLIDPKHVEFQAYELVPNLIGKVANETVHTRSLLELAVSEMNARYAEFRDMGIVRDRIKYNKLCESMDKQKMPAIVVVIDEYGDLVGQDPEIAGLVTALVRKGRAAGLHVVLATQRPTVDVVTGEIKANVPIRMALRAASSHDSRVVIDVSGAEGLAGNGDMLLRDQDGICKRLQGFYVSDDDLSHVRHWYD